MNELCLTDVCLQGRPGLPGLAGSDGRACTEDGTPPTGNSYKKLFNIDIFTFQIEPDRDLALII